MTAIRQNRSPALPRPTTETIISPAAGTKDSVPEDCRDPAVLESCRHRIIDGKEPAIGTRYLHDAVMDDRLVFPVHVAFRRRG